MKKSTLTYTLLFLLFFTLILVTPGLSEETKNKTPYPGNGRQDSKDGYVIN